MRRKRLMAWLFVMVLFTTGLLCGCSKNTEQETETEKDNLGNIGKILRSADHARVIKEYESLKGNEHNEAQMEKVLQDLEDLVHADKSNIMVDMRIGDYGNVEVRRLYRATNSSLTGVEARKEQINTVSIVREKNKDWRSTSAEGNESSEYSYCLERTDLEHGLYVLFDAKLDNMKKGIGLGEVGSKTYILVDDLYNRKVLYVVGCHKDKQYKNDWDMNIVQFISSDGSFRDVNREVYNVENTFIYRNGCDEVKAEALRVMNMYPGNGLNKKVKKAFK